MKKFSTELHEWFARVTPADDDYLCDLDVDFLTFATQGGANVASQASYASQPAVLTGYVTGIALSPLVNKTWRQGAFFSAVLAQLIATVRNEDVLDDGDLEGKTAQMWQTQLQINHFVDVGSVNAMLLNNPVTPAGALTFGEPGAGTTIQIVPANTNTGPTTLNWMGVGGFTTIPLKSPSGIPLSGGELVAGSPATLSLNAARTAWILLSSALTQTTLGANFDFYVNAGTGSDSNNGLAAVAGGGNGPWATIQHAWDYIQANINMNGHAITVRVANGTYASLVMSGSIVGQHGPASLIFVGNTGSPSSCIISVASGTCILAQQGTSIEVLGFKLQSASIASNDGLINAGGGSYINYGNIEFGAATGGNHVLSTGGSTVAAVNSETISGNAERHYNAFSGTITPQNQTVTLTGTPTFGVAFASANFSGGTLFASGMTFVGSATGSRYNANQLGVIFTGGGGASYFPGSTAGTDNGGPGSNGGVYA